MTPLDLRASHPRELLASSADPGAPTVLSPPRLSSTPAATAATTS